MVSYEAFFDWPLERMRALAPETVVYAASGTRRRAVLEGISLDGDDYASWTHAQMINSCDIIFDHGTQNVITILVTPSQFEEGGSYSERLIDWIQWGLTDKYTLHEFNLREWNVRIIANQSLQRLQEIDVLLQTRNQATRKKTLWCVAIQNENEMWSDVLNTIISERAHTLDDAIDAVYGANLTPASLFVGFGKPMISTFILPPLLIGKMDCYWSQKLGYSLEQNTWRSILYDFLYLRPMDTVDRHERAKAISSQPLAWNEEIILGLGARSNDHWHPVNSSRVT